MKVKSIIISSACIHKLQMIWVISKCCVIVVYWSLVMPYGDRDLGQHWLKQWLVTWQHQSITWTNVDFLSVRLCSIHLGGDSQREPNLSFCIMNLKIYLNIKITATCPLRPWVNTLYFVWFRQSQRSNPEECWVNESYGSTKNFKILFHSLVCVPMHGINTHIIQSRNINYLNDIGLSPCSQSWLMPFWYK